KCLYCSFRDPANFVQTILYKEAKSNRSLRLHTHHEQLGEHLGPC
ncbi:unnamed protein product, partial [Musa textilis]